MSDFPKLLYPIGISVTDFANDAIRIKRELALLGEEATKTFERDFGAKLAKSIDPARLGPEINRVKAALASIGTTAEKSFAQTLSREASKKLFDPFLDETQTLSGKIKSALKEGFNISSITTGVAGGLGLAFLGRELFQLGHDALGFAAQFETALAKVKTIADKGIDISAIRLEIKKMATEVPQDIVGLAEGLFSIIGSGIRGTADALNVLEISAKAAVAGVSTTAEASKAIVFILNGFQKDVSETQHVADLLFKTVDEGVVEFSQLASVVGDIAAPASAAGISLEDVSAAIATMTKGGISANETVTSLRMAISDIIAPSKTAQVEAKRLGLNFSKAGLEAAGGFAPFIKLIKETTKGDSAILSRLFPNERAMRALLQLGGSLADEFQRLSKQFNTLSEVSGATEKAFAVMNATAENQYTLFKNNLANSIESLGKSLLEGLKPALTIINEAFADTDPIDQAIAKMIEFGASADKVKLATLQQELRRTGIEYIDLKNKAAETLAELSVTGITTSKGDVIPEAARSDFAKGVRQFTEDYKEQLSTVEGLLRVEKARTEIRGILANVETNIQQLLVSQNKDEEWRLIAAQRIEQNLLGQLSAAERMIGVQQKLNAEAAKEQNLRTQINTLEKFQSSTQAEIQRDAQTAIKTIAELEKGITDAVNRRDTVTEENLRRQLETQRSILNTAKLFVTVEEQKAKKIKEQVASAESLKELAEDVLKRMDSVKDAFKAAKNAGEEGIKNLKAANDEQQKFKGEQEQAKKDQQQVAEDRQKFLAQGRQDLNDFSEAEKTRLANLKRLNEISAIELADLVNRNLGDITASFINFFNRVRSDSASTFSKFAGGASLFNTAVTSFFGKGITDIVFSSLSQGFSKVFHPNEALNRALLATAEARRLEDERLLEVQQDLAAQTATLRDALAGFGISQLEKSLLDTKLKLREFIGASRDLTEAEFDEVRKVQAELQRVSDEINAILRSGGDVPPELLKAQQDLTAKLAAMGVSVAGYTADQLLKIQALFQDSKLLQEALANFRGFTTGFEGLIDELNFKFDVLNIEDPLKKLDLLAKKIKTEFGAIIPVTEAGIRDLITQGLVALEAGGQTLVDFLKKNNLGALTAEQFKNFLSLLNNLANEAKDKLGTLIGDTEDLNIVAVRQITFTQGNKVIEELTTMRVLQTQMLEIMRSHNALSSLPRFQSLSAPGTKTNVFIVGDNGEATPATDNDLRKLNRKQFNQAIAVAHAKGQI